MCGIFGHVCPPHHRSHVIKTCLKGLSRLEYRGYDSSGIAGVLNGEIHIHKEVGSVRHLSLIVERLHLPYRLAIAHTRWATHGKPSVVNAHPHSDCHRSLAIVHNGVIENDQEIRSRLKKMGVPFQSETDSETIVQLIASYYRGEICRAVRRAMQDLRGSFAMALIHRDHPSEIVVASRDSPLIIGLDREKRHGYLASDIHSFDHKRLDIIYLNNDELATVKHDQVSLFDSKGQLIIPASKRVNTVQTTASKGRFEHFMLKEIYDQPETMNRIISQRCLFPAEALNLHELERAFPERKKIPWDRVLFVGCGSSWHAGLIAAPFLEQRVNVQAQACIASEFRYIPPLLSQQTLVVAISQSGETADTIAAMKKAKAGGASTLALCNVEGSTLGREADILLPLQAGQEISVCATKSFTSQLVLLFLFILWMEDRKGEKIEKEYVHLLTHLKKLPEQIASLLSREKDLFLLAKEYVAFQHFCFLGRGPMHPVSLEAALKLKEVSYLHATGYPAGEMKHGHIALVDPNLVIIGLCGHDATLDKLINNLMEVEVRGGRVLAFASQGQHDIQKVAERLFWVPRTCEPLSTILYAVAAQLFAYHMAKIHGREIDRPRNLAKSITVE